MSRKTYTPEYRAHVVALARGGAVQSRWPESSSRPRKPFAHGSRPPMRRTEAPWRKTRTREYEPWNGKYRCSKRRKKS